MKKIYLLLLLTSCLLTANAQKIKITNAHIDKINSIVKENYKSDQPGLSYLVAQGDKIILQQTIGMSEMEFNIKMEPEHIFAIGSVTKQFTAIAMLKLMEMGKVKLDVDIKTYLPKYNTHGEKITIANLLSHTSGIPSFTEMESFDKLYTINKTTDEILASFQDSSLLFKPGSNWSYSNSGYVISACIIEKVTGISFHEFMQKNIFDVAGMKNTYFGSNTKIYGKRAYGYDSETDSTVGKTTEYSWSWPFGAGDILSTTGDLFLWHKALSEGKIISKENVKLAFSAYQLSDGRSANYGYGWGIGKLNNKTIIEHGGAIGGYLSETARIEEDQIYIILLSNNTSISPGSTLSSIILTLLDLPEGNPKEIKTDVNYKEYLGSYEVNYMGARLTSNSTTEKIYRYITTENGKLFIQRSGRSKIELLPYEKDAFFIDKSSQRFKFLRDKNKKVYALEASSYPLQTGPTDICKLTDAPLPSATKEIKVPVTVLQKYIGTYELAPNFLLDVTVTDGQIFLQATGQSKIELFAKSETSFFIKVVDAKVDFNVDPNGNITSLFLTQGRKMEAKKIK